jgi:hypothetical protein
VLFLVCVFSVVKLFVFAYFESVNIIQCFDVGSENMLLLLLISADRLEDLTPPELIRQNPKVDRIVSLYGFVRGVSLNKMSSVHIPGKVMQCYVPVLAN